MKKKIAIGVDIGGSHISCALVNLEEVQILKGSVTRHSYDHTADINTILNIWATCIEKSVQSVPIKDEILGIGFAFPGPFNYRAGISMMQHKMSALFEKHIPTELKKHLSEHLNLEMRFINDASCFAIGEAFIAQDREKLTVITLGTGFGSAFLDNKIPIIHRPDTPHQGCLWHLPYKDGIADEYFSTRWFKQKYKLLTSKEIAGVKELVFNDKLDPHVDNIFLEFGTNLGNFLSPHLEKFGTDRLVIGGNISKSSDHFITILKDNLTTSKKVKVSISTLLEDAAIIGAALLLEPNYWPKVSTTLPDL